MHTSHHRVQKQMTRNRVRLKNRESVSLDLVRVSMPGFGLKHPPVTGDMAMLHRTALSRGRPSCGQEFL